MTDSPVGGADSPVVRVERLHKTFQRRHGGAVVPVDGISLHVAAGEFVVLLGPSGCGKTTLLRCVAGLELPDSGEVHLAGRCVFSGERRILVPPEKRSVGVVFQSYALWPHLTVFKNVAYPLRRARLPRAEVAERVGRVLRMTGVAHLAEQHPGRLSGGQQQRVALARALVAGNDAVLFDEPLSNVDAKVRDQLRGDLLEMQRELGFAALYVTHDQTEAMELGHRIAVLRDGRVEQLGTPREVYLRPATRYVANFVGKANELAGTVRDAGDGRVRLETALGVVHAVAAGPRDRGGSAVGVVRPESVRLTSSAEPHVANRWEGVVRDVVFGGGRTRIMVDVGEHRFEVWQPSTEDGAPAVGASVWVSFAPESCWLVPSAPMDVAS